MGRHDCARGALFEVVTGPVCVRSDCAKRQGKLERPAGRVRISHPAVLVADVVVPDARRASDSACGMAVQSASDPPFSAGAATTGYGGGSTDPGISRGKSARGTTARARS